MNLEDVGTQYVYNLLNMSFLQDEKKDESGNIESCKMHDLVHDLACFVAKDESSIVKVDEKISIPQGCRYSSAIYHAASSTSIVEIASEANKIRSFFLLPSSGKEYEIREADFDDPKFAKEISNLTRLRALHLDCIAGCNILNMLKELKHLRFLKLSYLKVEALPDSITDLRNLQTLHLGKCEVLKELPKSMMLMSSLRHLTMEWCHMLTGMPRGIGKLINLQAMKLFRVGREEGHASIAELQHLNQIKGDLTIDGMDIVKDPEDAMKASLSSKSGLITLNLKWWAKNGEASESCNNVLENLRPHLNLQRLCIHGYKGSRLPNWFANPFPNLAFLDLESIPNCESLPPLGLLPSLIVLNLSQVDAIKKVGEEFYGEAASAPSFPSLQRMSLCVAENLEEWSVPERDAFPSLKHLDIKWCPKMTTLGSMPSLFMSNLESVRNRPPPSLFMSLKSLTISDCPSLAALLPDWLGGAVSLLELRISDCHSLQMLPGIQHLSRLEELQFRDCPNLRMLPDGIQHLSGLESLNILRCPHLKRRCERETGEDWSKISHIPRLGIY